MWSFMEYITHSPNTMKENVWSDHTTMIEKLKTWRMVFMKLLTFINAGESRLGVKTDQGIVDVAAAAEKEGLSSPKNLLELINQGEEGLQNVKSILSTSPDVIRDEEVQYAPPLSKPEKMIFVGLNYEKHANEGGMPIPEKPIYFAKFANSLAGHREDIELSDFVKQVDYEVELVVVMSKKTRNVTKEEALDYVFGYSTGNDFSVRELQNRSSQWLFGKAHDKFAPFGPYVVTSDEVQDPQNLDLKLWVNGELRQNSNTADMIFSVAEIISDLSNIMTLEPGDVIFTGTPEGVILGMENKNWLKAGDQVVCEVEKLGSLENVLVSGDAVSAESKEDTFHEVK